MRKWIIIGVVAALVVGGIVIASTSGGGSEDKPVLITDTALVRDLRDEVTVPGTLERAEQRTVNWLGGGGGGSASAASASSGSVVSAVYLSDGAKLNPGDAILAVDGRRSVASPGEFPFFRKLDVGAEGSDVRQLKAILSAAGFQPGPADTRFTEQTRFALGQWQAAKGYPGASPATSQAVNVALQQGSGYQLGPQTSAGLTIGPPPARRAAVRTGAGISDVPAVSIAATSIAVTRGSIVSFTILAAAPVVGDTTVNLSLGGSLANADLIPSGATATVTLTDGSTSTSFQRFVLPNASALDQTLTVTVDPGTGYSVGDPSQATVKVLSTATPKLTVSGSTTISPGQSAVVTITADQATSTDLQVNLSVGGSAQADVDYVAFPPNVVLRAGQLSTSVTVQSKTSTTIKPDRFVVVGLAQGVGYGLGGITSATVTIRGDAGTVQPVATITSGNLRVNAGSPAQFTVSLDRPLSQALELSLSYSGNAVQGSDYNPAGGVVTVQPGQTSVSVNVPTLNNGLVQDDKYLFVGLAPQSTYVVGDPGVAGTLIVSTTLPKVSIYGGGAGVGLGGGVVFDVVADQPPVKDISVQYTVTGTAQQGKEIQPVTGSVIIPAGQTSVPISILTLNTNVYFLPTDIVVTTGGGQLGQILVKEGDVVPPGTALFTLTEPNIAVTLKASAADRTKLKVGQTATVQVQGGTASAPGVVTKLDDFPTTDPQNKQQAFKGTVQVQGDLGAADGTPVNVNVVVQERTAVLTVPIAAVKQNGSGVDVVRVIDLETGKTREVEVETGLSEGSYIEIKKGLTAKDVVVVELDQKSGG